MLARFAADFIVVLHLGFILFVGVGGLLVLRWTWISIFHLPAVVWAVLIEFKAWICPLTPLEKALRQRAGATGYPGGFIEHYLVPLIYPADLTRGIQIGIGTLVIIVNLAVYGWLLRRLLRRRENDA